MSEHKFNKPQFDPTQFDKTVFSINDLEEKWFTETVEYLFKGVKNFDFEDSAWADNLGDTYVKEYRDYNNKNQVDFSNQPGSIKINDLLFTIPPEAISIQHSNNTIDIPILRSKSSVKIDTGHGEINVALRLVFTDNSKYGISLEDELIYKMVPLLTQLRQMPFCHVRNEYLKTKITDALIDKKIDQEVPTIDNAELMLTYQNHNISTANESPRIIVLDLSFLMFNYFPYMNDVRYPAYFETDDSGIPIRHEESNKFVVHEHTVNAAKSLPFYYLLASEFKRREAIRSYSHDNVDDNLMELSFFEYDQVPTYLVNANLGEDTINVLGTKAFVNDTRNDFAINVGTIVTPSYSRLQKYGLVTSLFEDKIKEASDIFDIDVNFIKAVMTQESIKYAYNRTTSDELSIIATAAIRATSHAGAKGLMQLMPGTFKDMADKHPTHIKGDNIFDIEQNIFAGTAYLRWLYDYTRYTKGKTELVMAGYNAGPGNIHKYKTIPETKQYVLLVTGLLTAFEEQEEDTSETTTPNRDDLQNLNVGNVGLDQLNDGGYNVDKPGQYIPGDFDDPTITDNEKETIEYIKRISKVPGVTFIKHTDSAKLTYIRIPKKISIPRFLGIEMMMIESMGSHEVVRHPLSGHRYATHQYMGGHVEKLSMHFVVYDKFGDQELKKIQSVFNNVADNALHYKAFAAFDGVKIKQTYINNIIGSEYFVLDDIKIETHPDIPNGSLVTIVLTDFSGAREQAIKALGFETQALDLSTDGYYKSILQELFSQIDVKAYTHKKVSRGDLSYLYNDHISYENKHKTTKFISFDVNMPQFKGTQIYDIILELIDKLNKAGLELGAIYDGKKVPTDVHRDVYDISQFIDFTRSEDYIELPKAFSLEEGDMDFYNILKRWTQKWSAKLTQYYGQNNVELLEQTNKIFTKNIKETLHQIVVPAYPDFNLPPTIDPDLYFYQPRKYHHNVPDPKIDKIKKKSLQIAIERYKELTTQLEPGTVDGAIKLVKEIEDQLIIRPNESQAHLMKSDRFTIDKSDNKIGIAKDLHEKIVVDGGFASNSSLNQTTLEMTDTGIIVNRKELDKKDIYPRDKSEVLLFKDDAAYNEDLIRHRFERDDDNLMDFMRCFPTYKLWIIEEDETELLAPFRQDFNDMFGLNAITEIKLVQHSDQPADLLMIRFVDMTGRFTSAKYKEYAHDEGPKDPLTIDTKAENPFKGLVLKEGTSIQFRSGFSNNVNELEIMFNGIIVSIEGDKNEWYMVCQSHGVELVHDIKYPNEVVDIATFNAETKEILQWAINQPEVKHFGRWKYTSNSNYQFSDGADGVVAFNYKRIRPDGSTSKSWTWTKDEAEVNIIAPGESSFRGLEQWWENLYTDVGGSAVSIVEFWNWPEIFSKLWTTYYVSNRTAWEIIDEMTYRYPGYVAKVLPFEDRSTLFYGNPEAPYFYRRFTLSEGEKMSELDRQQIKALGTLNENSKRIPVYNSNGRFTRFETVVFDSGIQEDYNEAADKFSITRKQFQEATTRPFRGYHVASSHNNLIRNSMRGDYRDVYTEIQLGYTTSSLDMRQDIVQGKPVTDMITLRMNDFLEEEDIRSKYVQFGNVNQESVAYSYAAHQLWRESKKLYKGEILLTGNPKLKPLDYVFLFDDGTQTYGPVEVAQHIFTITPGNGMTSVIVPSMVTSIRNLVGMSNLEAFNHLAAGKQGVERMQASNSFFENLMTEQGNIIASKYVAGAGVGVAAGGVGLTLAGIATLGVGTAGAGFIIGLMFANLALKMLLAAKFRNPIILHPVMRMGAPYLYGLDTYKNLGLLAWYKNELKVLKEDLGAFTEIVSLAWDDLF